MAYSSRFYPMLSLRDLAIKLALENKWQDAITLNLQILEENPHDVDALNRLAFAYLKCNEFKKSKETYNKVITLDTTNPIALKNLKKLDMMLNDKNGANSNGEVHENAAFGIDNLYIEEAGKTKTVDLKNIADKKTLSRLQAGEMVIPTIKRSKIFILTQDGTFIGMLPDSIGMRIISLMKGGNEYQSCIKSITDKSVTVFIRETKQAAKFKNQPSFISGSPYHSKNT